MKSNNDRKCFQVSYDNFNYTSYQMHVRDKKEMSDTYI